MVKKMPPKMGMEGNYLNMVRSYDNPIAVIILNCEKPKAFPLRLGTRQRSLLSSLLFNSDYSFGSDSYSN